MSANNDISNDLLYKQFEVFESNLTKVNMLSGYVCVHFLQVQTTLIGIKTGRMAVLSIQLQAKSQHEYSKNINFSPGPVTLGNPDSCPGCW